MRRITWIAGAAVAMAVVGQGTAAMADTGDQLIGGCGLAVAKASPVTGDRFDGVIYEASASLDSTGSPTNAKVSCWVEVNGVEAPFTHLNAGGFGFQEGSLSTSYTATATDTVALCQQVSFFEAGAWTTPTTECNTLP